MVLTKYGRLPGIPNSLTPNHKERFKDIPKTSIWYYIKTFFLYNRYITGYFLYAILGEIEWQ